MTGKVFRSFGLFALIVAFIAAVPGSSDAQTSAKPVSLSGTWNMGLIGDHVIPVALVLDQNGTALKGTFIFMGRDFPVTGEVTGTTFSLTGKGPSFGSAPANHQPGTETTAKVAGPARPGENMPTADMTIKGTTGADGALSGELLTKMGERTGMIKWTAERLKERKAQSDAGASTAAVNVTGKWTLSVVEAQLQIAVDLKQVGSTITGSALSDHLGTMKIEGSLVAGVLTFSTTGSAEGQDVKIDYSGKYKTDGTFAGGLTSPMGAMTWTMAPVKK